MDMMELVKTRRSVRTFDGRPLTDEDENRLRTYMDDIPNPYGIPVRFLLLDAREHGLSSPVIVGESCYVTAKVDKVPHSEEAFGYSFEEYRTSILTMARDGGEGIGAMGIDTYYASFRFTS